MEVKEGDRARIKDGAVVKDAMGGGVVLKIYQKPEKK